MIEWNGLEFLEEPLSATGYLLDALMVLVLFVILSFST
jgi:hypothetical protein